MISVILVYATGINTLDPLFAARQRRTLVPMCSPWAKILYDTPRALNRLRVPFNIDFDFDVVRTCIINSKMAPLDINPDIGDRVPDSELWAKRFSHRVHAFFAYILCPTRYIIPSNNEAPHRMPRSLCV
jgi:hypothetical protein